MGKFLEQPSVALVHLDVSKNSITDTGLQIFCESLKINTTLKFLNLSGNKIKEEGL
jgi:Leucine Rich repeat